MTPERMRARLAVLADGPHDDDRTVAVAELAAEAVRFLNYATRAGGLTYPASVYTVAGSLALAASRLPQMLRQAGGFLARELEAGRLGQDDGRSPAGTVDAALFGLSAAAGAADDLARALNGVQAALSGTRQREARP